MNLKCLIKLSFDPGRLKASGPRRPHPVHLCPPSSSTVKSWFEEKLGVIDLNIDHDHPSKQVTLHTIVNVNDKLI